MRKRTRVGRPPADVKKESISIRLHPDVVASWRATGKGWMTRLAGKIAKLAPQAAR